MVYSKKDALPNDKLEGMPTIYPDTQAITDFEGVGVELDDSSLQLVPEPHRELFGKLEIYGIYELKAGGFRKIIHLETNMDPREMRKLSDKRNWSNCNPVVIHCACEKNGKTQSVEVIRKEVKRSMNEPPQVIDHKIKKAPHFRYWDPFKGEKHRKEGYPGCAATGLEAFYGIIKGGDKLKKESA